MDYRITMALKSGKVFELISGGFIVGGIKNNCFAVKTDNIDVLRVREIN